MLSNSRISPTVTSFSLRTVRRSRGAKRYFLPATMVTAYCNGWERMGANAEVITCCSTSHRMDGVWNKECHPTWSR